MFLIIPAGKISDSVSFRVSMPIVTIVKIISMILMTRLPQPDSIAANAVISVIIVTTYFQNTFGDTLFAKNVPKETRGLMMSVYQLTGSIG